MDQGCRYRTVVVVLVFVCLGGLDAVANPISRAKKLLRSEDLRDRRAGIGALLDMDSRAAVQPLEDAVRWSRKSMENLTEELDARDSEVGDAIRFWFWLRDHDKTEMLPYAARKVEEAEKRLEEVEARMRVELAFCRYAGIALSRFTSPGAVGKIAAGALHEPDPYTRQQYIGALSRVERRAHMPALLKALGQGDPRVRAAAARALRPFVIDPRVLAALEPLGGDPSWAVRLNTYETMARAQLEVAVPFLVDAVLREDGQMAKSIDALLFSLVGATFSARVEAWKAWWKENDQLIRTGLFRPPHDPRRRSVRGPTRATFFRIPIFSKNLLFALDYSGSMRAPYALKDARTNDVRRRYKLPATRLGFAKAEAARAILGLPEDARFNVLVYADEAKLMVKSPMRASKGNRERAVRWLLKQETGALTNIWDALRGSFRDHLADSGGRQRFSKLPDTVVFLTDGKPTRGRIRNRETLQDLVQTWSYAAGIVVHCVGIGEEHDRELLHALARQTHGYYVDLGRGSDSALRFHREVPVAERRPHFGRRLQSARELLGSEDYRARAEAAKRLATMGPHALPAATELVGALTDEYASVRRAAIGALAAVGPGVLDVVVPLLTAEDTREVEGALATLAGMGWEAAGALQHVLRLALDETGPHRVAALRAIASMGPAAKGAKSALQLLKRSKDSAVAQGAARALEAVLVR